LVEALKEIAKDQPSHVTPHAIPTPLERVGLPVFRNQAIATPQEAFFSEHQYLELQEAVGSISSEIVTVYPPGIPMLVPGEVITQEIVDYIKNMAGLGATIDGLNESNSLIGVVKGA
jgi:arginine/lysine/ornithine decarboxylase